MDNRTQKKPEQLSNLKGLHKKEEMIKNRGEVDPTTKKKKEVKKEKVRYKKSTLILGFFEAALRQCSKQRIKQTGVYNLEI